MVNEAVENTRGSFETHSGFNIRTKFNGSADNMWYVVIGPDYVENAFEYARRVLWSGVKLFYNDYNTFQPTKTEAIYRLASHLKERGLIDGIGMQGYMDLNYPAIDGGRVSLGLLCRGLRSWGWRFTSRSCRSGRLTHPLPRLSSRPIGTKPCSERSQRRIRRAEGLPTLRV